MTKQALEHRDRENRLYVERVQSGKGQRVAEALADIKWTIRHIPQAIEIAGQELASRYARSMLGPLWLVLGTITFIGAFSFLGTFLFKMPWTTYLNYLCAGIVFWQFIQTWLIESAGMYPASQVALHSTRTPTSYIPVTLLLRNLLVLAHGLPIVAVVAALTATQPVLWYMIPIGLLMGLFLLFPIGALLGFLGTRYRDTVPALSTILGFAVYVSPVWWDDSQVSGVARLIVDLNPVYYLLRVLRDPFLGVMTPLPIWLGAIFIAAVLWGLLAVVFVRFRRMIAIWV